MYSVKTGTLTCERQVPDTTKDWLSVQPLLHSDFLGISAAGRDGSQIRYVDPAKETIQSELAILAHSHLLVQHLLKQLELHRRDRNDRQRRPEWLIVFVHQVAALFEPMKGIGRVGSECEYTDAGWEARLYLGSTEIVGGKDDGRFQLIAFELDFVRLTESFTRLDDFRWSVSGTNEGSNSSFITLRGLVDDNQVSLKIYSRPPIEAGPALRQHSDGTVDATMHRP
jgi:hypothetical protein